MRHQEFTLTAKDGFQRFAQWWGPDGAPIGAVGIVHGLGEHSGRYSPIAEKLVAHGFLVVASDHRGHGKTGGRLPSFQVLSQDIEELYQCLQGKNESLLRQNVSIGPRLPRFLFGQSLGGALTLDFAIRENPDAAGIVASSPLLETALPPPAWKVWVGRVLCQVLPSFTLSNGLRRSDLTHDENAIRKHREDPLIHHRISAILGTTMLDAGKWLLAHADRLQTPTLLMHGTADRITSCDASRRFAERSTVCEFRSLPNLYHELHFEVESAIILDAMIKWLQSKIE